MAKMKQLDEKTARMLERIKKRMEERSITQEALGKKLGMPQHQVSRLLQGSPTMTLEQIYAIAEALDTTVEYLLLIRHCGLRELKQEDRDLLLAFDNADPETKKVIRRLLRQ